MSKVKIREGQKGFYNQHGNKKSALLEEGQSLKIQHCRLGRYVCSVVNPSPLCKDYGGYEGMLIVAYEEHLEVEDE